MIVCSIALPRNDTNRAPGWFRIMEIGCRRT
jgi:hypothetical protein